MPLDESTSALDFHNPAEGHAQGPTLPTLTSEALSDLYRLPVVRTQLQGHVGLHHTTVPL